MRDASELPSVSARLSFLAASIRLMRYLNRFVAAMPHALLLAIMKLEQKVRVQFAWSHPMNSNLLDVFWVMSRLSYDVWQLTPIICSCFQYLTVWVLAVKSIIRLTLIRINKVVTFFWFRHGVKIPGNKIAAKQLLTVVWVKMNLCDFQLWIETLYPIWFSHSWVNQDAFADHNVANCLLLQGNWPTNQQISSGVLFCQVKSSVMNHPVDLQHHFCFHLFPPTSANSFLLPIWIWTPHTMWCPSESGMRSTIKQAHTHTMYIYIYTYII